MRALLPTTAVQLRVAPLILAVLAPSSGFARSALQLEERAGAAARSAVPRGLPPALAETLAADSRALRRLGARLFADPLLSLDGSLACASCHLPERGHADAQRFSAGLDGVPTERNTPTLFNRALGKSFFWDGRAESLESQVLQPIASPRELGLGIDVAVERLVGQAEDRELFGAATGRAPDAAGIARALAAHVRGLLLGDSPVDRFRHGDRGALTGAERDGLWVYESRGRCWRCHSGANFTDEEFHNTGVGALDDPSSTVATGRAVVTGAASDQGRFKTPTLRGVALTAPYMHDGSLATLEDVVEFYRQGGNANPHLDARLEPLELTDREAASLVAFLRALSRVAEGPMQGEAR